MKTIHNVIRVLGAVILMVCMAACEKPGADPVLPEDDTDKDDSSEVVTPDRKSVV